MYTVGGSAEKINAFTPLLNVGINLARLCVFSFSRVQLFRKSACVLHLISGLTSKIPYDVCEVAYALLDVVIPSNQNLWVMLAFKQYLILVDKIHHPDVRACSWFIIVNCHDKDLTALLGRLKSKPHSR